MGGLTLTKKQKFLAGVVCSLIVLAPLSAAFSLARMLGTLADGRGTELSSPPMFAVYILGAAANVLVLLKFLLPNWTPHKKWLGWLLGASLLFSPIAFAALLPPLQSFEYGVGVIVEQFPITDWPLSMILLHVAIYVLYWLIIVLFSPHFHLLCGLWRKKNSEKIAGVFAAIGVAPLLAGLFLSIWFGYHNGFIWLTLLSMLIQSGYIIIYFTWPVLTRPILEIERPRSEEATEDIIL